MNRLSESVKRVSEEFARLSGATPSTTCPGCHKQVKPAGETCPECSFPLSRYAIRVKWLRAALIGAMLFGVAVVGIGLTLAMGFADTIGMVLLVAAAAGFVVAAVGLVGMLLGGRHTPGQERQSSGWSRPSDASE